MGYAQELKDLASEIQAAHRERKAGLRDLIKAHNARIKEIKGETNKIKGEIRDLIKAHNARIKEIKGEINEIKGETNEIKGEIRDSIKAHNARVKEIKGEVRAERKAAAKWWHKALKGPKLTKYQKFVRGYLKKHERATIKEAAEAWRKQKK